MHLNFNISNAFLLLIGLYFLIASAIDVGVAKKLDDKVEEKKTLVRNSTVALVVSIILILISGGMILGMIQSCSTETVYSKTF